MKILKEFFKIIIMLIFFIAEFVCVTTAFGMGGIYWTCLCFLFGWEITAFTFALFSYGGMFFFLFVLGDISLLLEWEEKILKSIDNIK